MDKVQAEAAADALLSSERCRPPRQASPTFRGYRTSKERWLVAVFAVAGALIGIGVFYFAAQRINGMVLLTGAEWGAGAGVLAGWLALWWRRVLTIRSTGRQPATRVSAG